MFTEDTTTNRKYHPIFYVNPVAITKNAVLIAITIMAHHIFLGCKCPST